MIELYLSRSGKPSARVKDINIHSPYDPIKEARKYIHTMFSNRVETVVLIAPGLNYLSLALLEKYPGIRIISLYTDEIFLQNRMIHENIGWFSKGGIPIRDFLFQNLPDMYLESVRIIEWPPSSRVFPSEVKNITREVAQYIRERNGSIKTTRSFGSQWIKNAIRNVAQTQSLSRITSNSSPIVIAASGPSLNKSISLLRTYRKNLVLMALPSSLRILSANQIVPDLFIHTDPGFFAGFHLHYYHSIPAVLPLTAKPLPESFNAPKVFFSQGTELERSLFDLIGEPPFLIPENGTVSGSALFFARNIGFSPVIFAGLDFSLNGLQSHCKPHTFDEFIEAASSRFSPLPTIYLKRLLSQGLLAGKSATTSALRTYAGWFSRFIHTLDFPIYRLFPAGQPVTGMISLDENEFKSLIEKRGPMQPLKITTSDSNGNSIDILLEKWRSDLSSLSELKKTHDPLLHDLLKYADIESYFRFIKKVSTLSDCDKELIQCRSALYRIIDTTYTHSEVY